MLYDNISNISQGSRRAKKEEMFFVFSRYMTVKSYIKSEKKRPKNPCTILCNVFQEM